MANAANRGVPFGFRHPSITPGSADLCLLRRSPESSFQFISMKAATTSKSVILSREECRRTTEPSFGIDDRVISVVLPSRLTRFQASPGSTVRKSRGEKSVAGGESTRVESKAGLFAHEKHCIAKPEKYLCVGLRGIVDPGKIGYYLFLESEV